MRTTALPNYCTYSVQTNKKILYHLEGKIGHKYTHNDVQNEISDIMAALTLQEKLKTIRERRFFSVIADKGTDVSTVIVLSTICG